MIVAFDSSVLIDLMNPHLEGDHRAKIDDLVQTLKQQRARILIPSPALAEVMIYADQARENYYAKMSKSPLFQIASFDGRAAVECSIMLEEALTKRERGAITKTKFKFDWQIVAIAKCRGADIIYAEDGDIERCALRAGVRFQKPSDLPVPAWARQVSLFDQPHLKDAQGALAQSSAPSQ